MRVSNSATWEQVMKGHEAKETAELTVTLALCAILISQLLQQTPNVSHSVRLLHYAQSSPVKNMNQSSVSYVSALVTAERSQQ